ncbi:MAG: succinate dehydrogenase, hydrophobic membrane anchor protein [Gammaproteobacteria bacterium]|nr:MAG: succinate dehydrogenase, hydrophobic membrane anchor protein [Gammaproteobacteria bacterium]
MVRRWRFGGAHAGLMEWLFQRLSALYLGICFIFPVVYFSLYPLNDHASWVAWWSQASVRLAMGLLFLSLYLHAWIGARSIALDYVKPFALRFMTLMAFGLFLLLLSMWSIQLLLSMGPV